MEELNLQDKPRILVLNKIDLMKNIQEKMNQNVISKSDAEKHNAVFISATKKPRIEIELFSDL